jgi:hypothetical protein
MFTWLTIGITLAALVYLGRNLARRFASDRIQQLMDRRRASCRLVSRGELIDGSRHVAVALALGASTLYYESSDLQASLDLEWIEEVEYDDEVVTGHSMGAGRILTLRCYSQAFAFLIPIDALAQWQAVLPAHRRAAAPAADSLLVSNRELSRADDDGWAVRAATS